MEDKRQIKAILFDLDGVLVNSLEAWHLAFNETLQKFGRNPLTREQFRRDCWGIGLDENMKRLGLGYEGSEYCRSRYVDHIDKVSILPGTREVLQSLDSRKGLVTSTPARQTELILNKFDLEKHFDAIITGDDVGKTKPDPEPVIKVCKRLNVDPPETILIGDNESDVQAGRAAGCKVIGFGVNGDFTADDMDDVQKILSKFLTGK